MATKRLDYIASTPVRERKPVMPRIYCIDGVSLSVQASSQHYSPTKANPGLMKGDDEGPWYALEVGFVSIEVPKKWPFVENHFSALRSHDHTGCSTNIMDLQIYCVDVEEIRQFIEDHGGETEDGKAPTPQSLTAEIARLREIIDAKYVELARARLLERSIWDNEIEELLDLAPESATQHEVEKVFLEKYAGPYNTALQQSHQLFDEWLILVERCAKLEKLQLAKLERELAQSAK